MYSVYADILIPDWYQAVGDVLHSGGGLIHQKVEIYGVHCAPFEILGNI